MEGEIIHLCPSQTHLLNPSMIELALRFYIVTASWLNQIAMAGDNFDDMATLEVQEMPEVQMPLPFEVGWWIKKCHHFSVRERWKRRQTHNN